MVNEGIEVNLVFYHLRILHFEPWCALAGGSACVHPLLGGWGQNVTKRYLTYNGNKTVRDDDSDTDSDNEMLMNSETNWARFLIVDSANEDLPLQKLSPFAIQKAFQAIAGTLKSIKRLAPSWWSAAKRPRPKTCSKPIY